MICCILAVLVAGPLGIVLAPIWGGRQGPAIGGQVCCPPRSGLKRAAITVLGVLLLSTLVALGLRFVDPPAFKHLCSWPAIH